MERLLTFIDGDDNRLELWLKPERIQLVVIDSRPELADAELRRFASALFAEYVAGGLAAELEAARLRLRDARGRAADDAALAGALDGALRALDAIAATVAVPPATPVLVEPERDAAIDPALDAAAPPRELTGMRPYPPLKPSRRGRRACESSALRWSTSGDAAAR